MEFKTYMCLICGWVYDEEAGLPEEGIAPGTLWKDVPMNWTCPECGARKEDFEMNVILVRELKDDRMAVIFLPLIVTRCVNNVMRV